MTSYYEYVYLVKCNEFYKVGKALDVGARLRTLQIGNPYPLTLLAAIPTMNALETEAAFHIRFKDKHSRGEWFELDTNDIKDFLIMWIVAYDDKAKQSN